MTAFGLFSPICHYHPSSSLDRCSSLPLNYKPLFITALKVGLCNWANKEVDNKRQKKCGLGCVIFFSSYFWVLARRSSISS